jgi:hypothetical protein
MNDFNNLTHNLQNAIIIFIIIILFATFYFIKKFESSNIQIKIILIIVIFGLIFKIYSIFAEHKNYLELKNNFSLTNGHIDLYFVPKIKGGIPSRGIPASTNSITYSFKIHDSIIKCDNLDGVYIYLPDEKPNLKIEYLVIYENNNPKNSFILLDYPINNNGDLEKYKKLFSQKIPDNAFKISQ